MSRKGDYGIILLTALAKTIDQEFTPLQQLAKDNNLPYKFISQIALLLKDGGLIRSKEGLGGGYRLARLPQEITLAQAVNVLEGPITPVPCMRGKVCSCKAFCRHKKVMNNLAHTVQTSLSGYTLADLV